MYIVKFHAGLERGVLIFGSSSDIEKQDYESKFDEVPPPFTQEDREAWISELREVAVSSDAFVSHDNGRPFEYPLIFERSFPSLTMF